MEKKSRKRWLAGALAVVMCCSALLPAGTYAASAETEGIYQEAGTETQAETEAQKSEEELISEIEATPDLALTITAGEAFDVRTDFTGLNLKDGETAELKLAEAEDGTKFDVQVPGIYKCVYQVTPVSGEAYLVARNITVTPRESETSGAGGQTGNDGDTGGTEEGESDSEPDPENANGIFGTEALLTEGTEPVMETPAETEGTDQADQAQGGENILTEGQTEATEPAQEETAESEAQTEPPVTEAESEAETEPVTEPGTEAESTEGITEGQTEETQAPVEETRTETEGMPDSEAESETATETEILSEEELDKELEAAAEQDTYDEESGLTLGEVMEQAVEQEVNLLALDAGETVSFMAVNTAARSTQSVNVTRGSAYYYADYGLGSYVTYKYTVQFGDISATAYCVEPSKGSPGDGTYTITRLSDGRQLAKVCYYGTKASGENGFFAEKHPDFSAGKQFIITHLAVAYANGSGDAFSGANSTGQSLAMELYNYCMSQPDIPDVDMSFSDANTTAYIDGTIQRTKEITFRADELQKVTMKLPDGVKLHNQTTGETSKAGADVEISGGTVFYLTAPLTQASDVGASWSTRMKGSITKDYSAYKISTGSGMQDLALVFGEGVTTEKYVEFQVNWVEQSKVEIIKKDKGSNTAIAGAIYGIYSDEACKNLIVQMPATDEKGASSVTLDQASGTVYLKEIDVPTGYLLDTKAYNIELVAGGTVKQEVFDEEQKAALTVYKEGEVLTGADVTDHGVTFRYEKRRLKGAVYNVYAAEDIISASGKLIYNKGALVKEALTTGADGSAVLENLYLGSYTITETKAPENYVCTGESKTVKLEYAGANVAVQTGSVTFTNSRQKASVSVTKQDQETKVPLAGGIYGLYAGSDIKTADGAVAVKKDTLIEKVTTGSGGSASYAADLPIGSDYYIKELQAPANYLRNSEEIYTFSFAYTNDKEASVSFTHTFSNERVDATIHLIKKDAETGGTPQGDAVFTGAVYGLFAREDIVHPDGKTGVLFKEGTQVATLTVDEAGNAEVTGLYLGKYYVKELTPPVGYLADPKEYDLDCSYEGDLVKTIERTVTSTEVVKKQPFQLIKAANNGQTDAELLKGAGFSAYLVSDLKKNEDGSYDFTGAKPIVITADGQTEMFTDEKGYACSIPIPYGTYVVRETTTPHNFTPVRDFIVTISENNTEPQTWRVLLDDEFMAKLKIVKKDDETKQSVLIPNTEFKVYDLDAGKYVEQVTTYPSTIVHKSYFTDESGYLILPNALPCGNYRIEEVTAPDGYVLNPQYVEIQVDSNTAYEMDSISNDAIITVSYENHPVKGKLVIKKAGEVLESFGEEFKYKEASLAGAEFEIYAAETIYTADHQVDEQGNRHVEYEKDTLVATVVTDENGEASVDNLPLGKYRITETKAPEGYVLNTESQEVLFTYEGQNTPVVEQEVLFQNERQKVEISVQKQDAETETPLSGAVFGLYNQEDIQADGKVVVPADTLLEKAESQEDGFAAFTLDLPLGQYYVKEEAAPDGYVSSDEILEFDASYQGQEIPVLTLSAVKKNEPTLVEFTKTDITTGTELSGASMTVLDAAGEVVDSWVSQKGQPHVIRRLHVGETYTLREEIAPYGYLKATEVSFTVLDTGEVQKVVMEDEVPTAKLIVNKKGEFLDKVTLLDNAKGVVEHLFEYISGSLSNVTFEVYAAENIKAADGVSPDYYAADELVATITTDQNGIAQIEDLPLGRYYIKEAATEYGYVLDEEPRYVDLTYRDQDTPVVTYDESWQNNRQRVQVEVVKKENGTERLLAGAIFGLFTAEDILAADGDLLLEADTIIELKTTGEDGKIQFVADLPVGGSYYVKELYAPDGFVNLEETQEFTFEYEDEKAAKRAYSFTFEDEPTSIALSKKDLTSGEELPGASLQVLDEEGNVVDEWISTEEPHIITELTVGKTYKMVERKPADGYVTAESISFTVENTAELQTHVMEDDVTKVQISKTDITDSKEVPGAKLSILDQNGDVVEQWTSGKEPHYIEKLPIGTYTLREEQAPEGYLVAEDVEFEIADTGEIQKVEMKDARPSGSLVIKKTDADTKLPLEGVEFALKDKETGKTVAELKTDSNGTAVCEDLPIGVYKNGKLKETTEYILTETKALEGYESSSEEISILFEYVDDKTEEIVITKELTNTKVPEEEIPDTPKTGDSTNLWLPVLLLLLSAGGIAAVIWYMKKKK